MWSFKKRKEYYRGLLKEVETVLIKNGVTPIYLFKEPRVLSYLTYYPINHIYCFLAQKDMNFYLNNQGRDFAKFIMKLAKVREKSINLLLDTPTDYEFDYPSCVGWKDNPKYEEEVKNYRFKLAEYEEQKKIAAQKRKQLWEKPEAAIYIHVGDEYNQAKCPDCLGAGIIPAIDKQSGFTCPRCRGTGKTAYRPNVTPEQLRAANRFKEGLDRLKDPEFTSFPRKKKSVFIKVIHGGQIFLVEK